MPNAKNLVINTSPLLALSAALGDLNLLRDLYHQVFVPTKKGINFLWLKLSITCKPEEFGWAKALLILH